MGVVKDDFNRDGLDDLFISNGAVMSPEIDAFYAHFDAIFMQNEQGFSLHSGDLGIALSPLRTASTKTAPTAAARCFPISTATAISTSSVLTRGRLLPPRVPHRREDTLRCTLVPLDRYVPGYGIAHTLISPQGDERRRDSQGQNCSGACPLCSAHGRAASSLASGAEVPFNCEDSPGPIVVSEPEACSDARGGPIAQLSPDAPAGHEHSP